MIKAKIIIQTPSQRVSRSIVKCVEPDNMRMKGLLITSRASPDSALFQIKCEGRIETFISTLDDLLRCVQAANATLGIIRNNQAS